MRIVYFIRHGESESNAGMRTEETRTVRLTEKGQRQAELTAQALLRPGLVVTSPYLRTKETAAPLLQRYPDVPQAEWPIHEFTYMTPEQWRNTTSEERRPVLGAYWQRNDPFEAAGPGSESFATMLGRARETRERILACAEERLCLFSHGIFGRAFLWNLLLNNPPIDTESMRRFRAFASGFLFPNCGIIEYRLDAGKTFFSNFQTDHLKDVISTE